MNPGPAGTSSLRACGEVVTRGPAGARTWFPGDHLRADPGHQGNNSGLPPTEPQRGWVSGNQISHGAAPSGSTRARDPGIPGTTQRRAQPRGHYLTTAAIAPRRRGCGPAAQKEMRTISRSIRCPIVANHEIPPGVRQTIPPPRGREIPTLGGANI